MNRNDFSESDLKVIEEVLRRNGINMTPQPSGVQSGLQLAGTALGAGADASAANRSAGVDAAMLQEQLNQSRQGLTLNSRLAKSRDDRESGSNAFREMQRAEYLQNATGYTPRAGLKSYGFGPKAPTENELRSTRAYAEEMMRRLEGGSAIPEVQDPGAFQFDPKLLEPGMAEHLMGYGGMAANVAGAIPASGWKRVGQGALKALKWIFVVLFVLGGSL